MSRPIEHGDALVRRARDGDEDALWLLLERHLFELGPWIASQIEQRYQSMVNAEDVLQQTGLDAYRGIRKLVAEDEAGFCAWLKKVAQHNLIGVLRWLKAGKRPPPDRRVLPAGSNSTQTLFDTLFGLDSQTPSRVAVSSERERLLYAAIERLTETQRLVVQLYDLQNLPIEEVAAKAGRTIGAVYMLRSRAHEQLRADLGGISENSAWHS